jgi:hypothetical protein
MRTVPAFMGPQCLEHCLSPWGRDQRPRGRNEVLADRATHPPTSGRKSNQWKWPIVGTQNSLCLWTSPQGGGRDNSRRKHLPPPLPRRSVNSSTGWRPPSLSLAVVQPPLDLVLHRAPCISAATQHKTSTEPHTQSIESQVNHPIMVLAPKLLCWRTGAAPPTVCPGGFLCNVHQNWW